MSHLFLNTSFQFVVPKAPDNSVEKVSLRKRVISQSVFRLGILELYISVDSDSRCRRSKDTTNSMHLKIKPINRPTSSTLKIVAYFGTIQGTIHLKLRTH
jgi:hypothetical protein